MKCEVRQATIEYVDGGLAVQLKGDDVCRTSLVSFAIRVDDVKSFLAWVKNRREHRGEWGEPRFYGPEGSGIEIGYDDTSTRLGACGSLGFFVHGAALVIDTWPEDLDVLEEFAAGLEADVVPEAGAGEGQQGEGQKSNEDNYIPNATCPHCHDETMPEKEMEWTGWGLEIKQTCQECGRRWYETWHLTRVDLEDCYGRRSDSPKGVALAPSPNPDGGNAKFMSQDDLMFLDELKAME